MSKLLEEWFKYCSETEDLDPSHFMGLFKSDLSSDQIAAALSVFQDSSEIHSRLSRVLEAGQLGRYAYLQPKEVEATEGQVTQAARRWLDELASFCRDRDNEEFYDFAHRAKVVSASNDDVDSALAQDIPGSWISEFVGDEVRESYPADAPEIYGLSEALYGLAADYYLSWYVMQPLIDLPIDFSKYFDLWRLGARCALTEGHLLVAHRRTG